MLKLRTLEDSKRFLYIDIVFTYTNLIQRTLLDEIIEKSSIEVLEIPPIVIISAFCSVTRYLFLFIIY